MKIPIKNNIYVQLDKGNLRGFTLYTNSKNIVVKEDEEYYITAIIIEDSYTLKIGDEVLVDDIKYNITKIRRNGNTFFCVQEKATKTSQFIMPILGYDYSYFDFEESFYNSYLADNYHSIFLVYKFINSEKYLKLEEKLRYHPYFKQIIDPNPEYVVIELNLDDRYWRDIDLIMRGKYSSISPTLKSKICIFHLFGTKSKTYRMLYRDKTLREEMSEEYGYDIPDSIDLMSKPDINEELWSLTSISQKIGIVN